MRFLRHFENISNLKINIGDIIKSKNYYYVITGKYKEINGTDWIKVIPIGEENERGLILRFQFKEMHLDRLHDDSQPPEYLWNIDEKFMLQVAKYLKGSELEYILDIWKDDIPELDMHLQSDKFNL